MDAPGGLEITAFGGLTVRVGGGPLSLFPEKVPGSADAYAGKKTGKERDPHARGKLIVGLILLAPNPSRHPSPWEGVVVDGKAVAGLPDREHLARLVYDEGSLAARKTRLRYLVSDLKRALPKLWAHVEREGHQTLRLRPASETCDAFRFDTAVANMRVAEDGGAGAEDARLRYGNENFGRYPGELMRGIEPFLTDNGRTVLEAARTERSLNWAWVCLDLAESALAAGDLRAAAGYWERLVEPDVPGIRLLAKYEPAKLGRFAVAFLPRAAGARLLTNPDDVCKRLEEHFQALRGSDARNGLQLRECLSRVKESAAPRSDGKREAVFVGRYEEVRRLSEKVVIDRLVTLWGPPGVGKSRLAARVAEDVSVTFDSPVAFARLADIADPGAVAHAVARAAGLEPSPNRPETEEVFRFYKNKYALLVVDNCEHVIEGAADFIKSLLDECPKVTVLATSRTPLKLRAELRWRVEPLPFPPPGPLPVGPDAVRVAGDCAAAVLFTDRLRMVNPDFALSEENATDVLALARALEGLPLALELAAARGREMSLREMLDGLRERFRLLEGEMRDAEPRHRTLRAALDWSYELLDENARLLLRRLAPFAGGWTRESASAVCAAYGPARAAFPFDAAHRALLDHALITREETADGSSRFYQLQTVREYAALRCAPQERQEAADAHLAHFADRAGMWEAAFLGDRQSEALAAFTAEHANYAAAAEWGASGGDAEAGLRLCGALAPYWRWGHMEEGRRHLGRMLSRSAAPGGSRVSPARLKALYRTASIAYLQNDLPAADGLYGEALALARDSGDERALGICLRGQGSVAAGRNDYASAYRLYDEGLALARSLGDTAGIVVSLINLGSIAGVRGFYELARELLDESLGYAASPQVREELAASAYCEAGAVAFWSGDHAGAEDHLRKAVEIDRRLDTQGTMAVGLLGRVRLAAGDLPEASALFEEHLSGARVSGNKRCLSVALANAGESHLLLGETGRAAAALQECATLTKQTDNRLDLGRLIAILAKFSLSTGDIDGAARFRGLADAVYQGIDCPAPAYERVVLTECMSSCSGAVSLGAVEQAYRDAKNAPVPDATECVASFFRSLAPADAR